ncbi:MAG: DUF3617 family protein [Gammaproteobacteria bacterium]
MMFSTKHTPRTLLGCLLFACALPAAAVTLEPGKWEMSVTSQNPMTGQPVNRTSVECIEEGSYDPSQMMTDNQECRMLDMQDDGNSVTWKMACSAGEGMPDMNAEGHFESQGKTASGEMVMSMSFNGMNMEIRNTWQGKFISAKCD